MELRKTLQRLLLLCAFVLSSCPRPATQLLLVIDSDFPTPSRLARLRITTMSGDGQMMFGAPSTIEVLGRNVADEATRFSLPLSFGVASNIIPRDGLVRVRVEGLTAADERIVVRELRTNYRAGKVLRVPVFLARICGAVDCSMIDQSCREYDGRCHPIDVPPEEVSEFSGARGNELTGRISHADGGSDEGSGVDASAGATVVEALVAGDNHTCALLQPRGAVRCWGENNLGQLGNPTPSSGPRAVALAGFVSLENVRSLVAGGNSTCATTADGLVYCWGSNANGQLGIEGSAPPGVAVRVSGLETMQRVALGRTHSCGIRDAGEVRCWGSNRFGQVGNGLSGGEVLLSAAQPITSLSRVSQVVVGVDFSCAIALGSLQCWGASELGQTTGMRRVNALTPVPFPGLTTAAEVLLGNSFGCVRTPGLRCWGDNSAGQVGSGSMESPSLLASVAGTGEPARLFVGGRHACFIDAAMNVWCWGANDDGQLGVSATTTAMVPTPAPQLRGVSSLALGLAHSCGVFDNRRVVRCWGNNRSNQLLAGELPRTSVPQDIAGLF